MIPYATWVSYRAEEESEGEKQPQQGRMSSKDIHHGRVENIHPIPSDCGAVISWPTSNSSVLWAFFSRCTADCTVAICNFRCKQIKHGKNTSYFGTTCLTRNFTSHHSAPWQQHLKSTHKGYKYSSSLLTFHFYPSYIS